MTSFCCGTKAEGPVINGNANGLSEVCNCKSINPCVEDYINKAQPITERVPCIGDYEQHLFETPAEDICDKGPRDPYHIPGYSGHVPTLQSRSGGTFGHDTHDVLMSRNGLDNVSFGKGSHICPVPLHEPYRIPGYTGHVPGLQGMVGGTYGHDTHKLLYSVDSYPTRQENLSPYRPGYINNCGDEGHSEEISDRKQNGQNGSQHFQNKPDNGPLTTLSPRQKQQSGRIAEEFPHTVQNGHSNHHQVQDKFSQGQHSISSPYQKPKERYYQPNYKYRIADTYATKQDLTLFDPCILKESNVVVSTRELDDTQVIRKQDCLEERVEELPYIYKPLRHHPMVPGFDAFIDAMRGARGQRFEFTASSPSHLKLQQQLILHRGRYKEPLRREEPGIDRDGKQNQGFNPAGRNDLPFGYGKFGEHHRYTNSALYDFTSNYRRRMSAEWAPAGISRPDPPIFDIPGEIYNQHMGLLPGYSAHIPGSQFRCGKTFTDDSRDARRALRGDRF